MGDTITVELFNDAAYVDVVGTSKGKGFQGVVKRHGFGGVGQTTHGQHNRARKPGSIGACSYPAKYSKECVWVAKWVVTALLHITYRY